MDLHANTPQEPARVVQAELTTFADIQTIDMAGSSGKVYQDVRDFAAALAASSPDRIMTKTSSALFLATYTAAFIDERGTVHATMLADYRGGMEQVKPIYDVIKSRNIPEVDGVITGSPINGSIYHRFSPDSDEPECVKKNYDAYVAAVQRIADKDAQARFVLSDGEAATLNVRCGKHHFITRLPIDGEMSLEKTLAKFPGIPASDETWVAEALK